MAQRRAHNQHASFRTGRTPREGASPVPDGKVRCPACGRDVGLTKTGVMRRHNDDSTGDLCPVRFGTRKVDLEELPPVVVPPQRGGGVREVKPRPERPSSRLDAGSECQDCGRWLPGERSLCGRCARHRDQDRT